MVTSRLLLQTKTLRATGLFKIASNCCQIAHLEHRMSIQFEGSLVGFLCIKAELFKVIQSASDIDRASHT